MQWHCHCCTVEKVFSNSLKREIQGQSCLVQGGKWDNERGKPKCQKCFVFIIQNAWLSGTGYILPWYHSQVLHQGCNGWMHRVWPWLKLSNIIIEANLVWKHFKKKIRCHICLLLEISLEIEHWWLFEFLSHWWEPLNQLHLHLLGQVVCHL